MTDPRWRYRAGVGWQCLGHPECLTFGSYVELVDHFADHDQEQ